jgi:UDPglucose 6-dehydrogenase
MKDLGQFKGVSDVIVANRKSSDLANVDEKCFSRDLFGNN